MPEIPVDAQVFDLVFHPTFSTVYAGLLTGYVKAFAYDQQGNHKSVFSLRPSKRSCRGLSINEDGSRLYAVGKSKALHIIDTKTEQVESRTGAHESAINRVKHLTPWLLSTGDDEGVIKLWDPRQREAVRSYTHHFDYISDFLWLEDKKQLLATSADGTLSVMDVRSKKPKFVAQSEDQEDELLSIVAIKGMSKVIIGTQLGILSVFNRNSGWGDCVDRIPGHPLSIDALCNLPSDLPDIDTTSTILTGSSDGFVRAVQILPTKLLGVVADHGDWPVERVAVGSGAAQLSIDGEEVNDSDEEWHGVDTARNQTSGSTARADEANDSASPGRWWVGSVGHENGLRLTDLMSFFRDGKHQQTGTLGVENDSDSEDRSSEAVSGEDDGKSGDEVGTQEIEAEPEEEPVQAPAKRKRKHEREPMETKKKGKKNAVVVEDTSFFGDLE
ncbi:WD repeat-containing protein JIP5 [Macrolepiota fuliginosa MF-IS2]|uniref:WD repeat-containing protein JIP5 n=1 Tax=Macrolepiota fuliginosa MF-IS2 TaxID=1400762 RepID=A0A9P6BZ64_9AGAR|nr:WD repeat-containing protein JIP5 [Macrolepiota fuliginosa MF-IS2]